MAMIKQNFKNDCIIFNTLNDLVPQDHLVRKLDNCIDFTFIEDLVNDLYSPFGRPSIPPVVLFKLIFINIIFGINSMRRTCEECKVNIAYRLFLGLSMFDEETGELKENVETKHIKESLTDPESGCFHKGEKEKCFAYTHQVFCDKNGFVLASTTNPGNIHDSVAFFEAYRVLNEKFKDKIKNVCLDAGYVNPAICREIILNKHTPLMPYKRPMTGKGLFKKYEYVYDEYYDCYICPNNEILSYSTTDKNGYKQYKSNPEKCKDCPLREKCTKSKNMQKIVTRHIWEEYKEEANANRYTKNWKENYPQRKETIERVFGDCKEQHNLRFTRIRGLLKNEHNTTMIFACHNLKKMANWRRKKHPNMSSIIQLLAKFTNKFKKIGTFFLEHAILSTI